MKYIKKGELFNGSSGNSYQILDDDTVAIVNLIRQETKPITYQSELKIFRNFELIFSEIFDKIITVDDFLVETNEIVINYYPTNWYLLNVITFNFNETIVNGSQITCKIGDKYLINNKFLHQFYPPFQLEFEKLVGLNPHYHNTLPKYYAYGTPKTTDEWQTVPDMAFISNFSLETGKELWSYNILERFPEKFTNTWGKEFQVEVSRFIGDEPNKIWLYLNNGGVLVLDALTGKELALVGKPITKDYCPPYPEGISETAAAGYLDEKNKKVISLIDCYYHEINTEAYELTFINLKEEFEKHAVNSIGQIYFDDDYIYFYDKKFMGSNQCVKIALLNRKTFNIDWSYDFAEKEQSFPMSLEVYGNKIFVVDGSQRLHIFEKEAE